MHKAHVCGDVVVTHVFDLQVLFEDYIHNKNEKEKKNIMKEKDRGRGTKTLPWHPPRRYGFPSKPFSQEHVKVVAFRLALLTRNSVQLEFEDVLLAIGSEGSDVYGSPHSNATGTSRKVILSEPCFWNHVSSTKNAYMQSGMKKRWTGQLPSLRFNESTAVIVVLKATRCEGIAVWQQLMPLHLLVFTTLVTSWSQMDKHPRRVFESFKDTIEAKLLQPMAVNLLSDWEKMKGLFARFTFGILVVVPLLQIKDVG
jgi:hypothetical protein